MKFNLKNVRSGILGGLISLENAQGLEGSLGVLRSRATLKGKIIGRQGSV